MTMQELMQKFVDASYEELLDAAKDALNVVYPKIEEVFADNKDVSTGDILLMFISTTIASDGYFTDLEYRFFCDLTGTDYSYEKVKGFIAQHLGEEFKKSADILFDNIASDNESKNALFILCLAVCSVDKTINTEEIAFIRRLVENN